MLKKISIILALIALLAGAFPVNAHSGRTDSYGGHKDNKNSSGLGPYHYHHSYPAHLHTNGMCPYKSPAGNSRPSQNTQPSTPANPSQNSLKAADSANAKSKKEKYTVIVEKTAIYQKASSSAKVLSNCKEGYTFSPVGSTKSFWKIEFTKKDDSTVYTGYILKEDAKIKS